MYRSERVYSWVVFALGFTSIAVQIVLLREFLNIFYGNELVIGIILANWMILIGVGAFSGRFAIFSNIPKAIIILLILIAFLPLVSIFFLNYLRNIFFDVGVQLSITEIFLYSFLIMLPFCFLSGLFFTFLSTITSEKYTKNLIGKVYAIESIGSVVAGILMSLVLTFYLSNVQILILIFLFNLTIVLVLTFIWNYLFTRIIILIFAISLVLWNYFINLDKQLKEYIYPNHKIVYYKNTPYGNLVITETQNQRNVYENSLLLFSMDDPISNEEAVHYAMVQSKQPENVLLISGGISGIIDEILKYKISKVDYVELNPFIIKLRNYFSDRKFDNRVNFSATDARLYVKNVATVYDVILVNLPEPSTAQINRYYTVEFLKELKKKMNPKAIVSYSLSSSADYMSTEAIKFKSVLYQTLKNSFKNILIIPGYRDFYICSDGELSLKIPELIENLGIENLYVNKYYLDTTILARRSEFILKNLEKDKTLNTDFNPITYYHQIMYWLSQFNVDFRYVIIFLMTLLIILIFKLDYLSYGMFAGGFAASGNSFLLIIAFQIIYGYVYQMIGIIIATFMLGLAIGALLQSKFFLNVKNLHYAFIQFCIFLLSISIPLLLMLINKVVLDSTFVFIFIIFLTITVGCVVGLEFAVAVNLRKDRYEKIASEIYSIDMIGSAVGSLIVAIFLLPLLGFIYSGLIIGGMNLVGCMLTYMKRNLNYE